MDTAHTHLGIDAVGNVEEHVEKLKISQILTCKQNVKCLV